MTAFEITGQTLNGGKDPEHTASLLKRVKTLEEYAKAIGKTLGMSTVNSGVVANEDNAYGFRFATTSDEKFDAKGVEMDGKHLPSDIVNQF